MSVGFQAVNTAVRQRMQEWCASVFKDYLEDFIANIASDDHAPSNSPLTSVKVDPMVVEQVGVEITDETFVDHALEEHSPPSHPTSQLASRTTGWPTKPVG